MAIRKRYELVVNGRSVLRLRPKQDKVVLEQRSDFSYGGWAEKVTLDREAVLELRDCLDSILSDWFCPPEAHRICPVCEDMLTSKKSDPLVFSPADVGRLDSGTFEQSVAAPAMLWREATVDEVAPERPVGCGEDYILAGRQTGQEMHGGCEISSVEADEEYLERLRRTT